VRRIKQTYKYWTKKEERIIRLYYGTHGSQYVADMLKRTVASVQDRARMLGVPGVRHRRWSAGEVEYLTKNYGKRTTEQIARTLRRSIPSVQGAVQTYGLGLEGAEKWTEAEIEYLRRNYRKIPTKELAADLGRTTVSVIIKARRIGVSQSPATLTAKQLAWVKANLGKISYRDMAKRTGVAPSRIEKVAAESGHTPRAHVRPWTEEEDITVRELYGTRTLGEIGGMLNRSAAAISMRANHLGLRKKLPNGRPKVWTPKDDQFLRTNWQRMTIRELAERLGRTRKAVTHRVEKLGLRSRD
jgi:transcriptional regulator with XRE-family HTH domain